MVRAFYIRAVFTVPICVLSSLAFISYVNMFIALVEMNTVLINWRVEGSFSFHTASLYSKTHLFWYICVYWSVLNAHFHLKSYFNYLWAVKIIILFSILHKTIRSCLLYVSWSSVSFLELCVLYVYLSRPLRLYNPAFFCHPSEACSVLRSPYGEREFGEKKAPQSHYTCWHCPCNSGEITASVPAEVEKVP